MPMELSTEVVSDETPVNSIKKDAAERYIPLCASR